MSGDESREIPPAGGGAARTQANTAPPGSPASGPPAAAWEGITRPAPPATAPPAPTVVEVLIPYKNGAALTAYYLAVFSILCGFVLGIPAVVLGIMGLRRARLHPEARGKAHAWVGIVLGGLMTLVSLTLIGLAAASFLTARR